MRVSFKNFQISVLGVLVCGLLLGACKKSVEEGTSQVDSRSTGHLAHCAVVTRDVNGGYYSAALLPIPAKDCNASYFGMENSANYSQKMQENFTQAAIYLKKNFSDCQEYVDLILPKMIGDYTRQYALSDEEMKASYQGVRYIPIGNMVEVGMTPLAKQTLVQKGWSEEAIRSLAPATREEYEAAEMSEFAGGVFNVGIGLPSGDRCNKAYISRGYKEDPDLVEFLDKAPHGKPGKRILRMFCSYGKTTNPEDRCIGLAEEF